jgi:hypothetical protein
VRPPALILGVAILLAASGCGGDGGSGAAPASSTATSAETTTAGPALNPRCVEATTTITRGISSGLKGKGRTLKNAYAVKSTEFGSVFFVSGNIDGAPSYPMATWATNNLNLGGLMFSVDGTAKRLSRWANGSKFEPKLTMRLDGARLSRDCSRKASR